MREHTAVSERRACGLVGISRSVLRYEAVRGAADEALRGRLIDLAQQRRRFGYRRIHALLRREGVTTNHKKVRCACTRRKASRCASAGGARAWRWTASRWSFRARRTRSGRWTSSWMRRPTGGASRC